jgi:Bacterial aa3 type cytochrome c oxidase subunit IV
MIDTSKGHPEMDYAEHTATYKGFLTLTKFAIIFLVALMVGMYFFLVR